MRRQHAGLAHFHGPHISVRTDTYRDCHLCLRQMAGQGPLRVPCRSVLELARPVVLPESTSHRGHVQRQESGLFAPRMRRPPW
jgi:hypothetical protein